MSYNRDKAHEVSDDGLLITDGPLVIGGTLHPTVALPAPTGDTFYTDTSTGRLWIWRGSGPWRIETNFSFKDVAAAEAIRVNSGEQTLFNGNLRVVGHLEVAGELVDISKRQPEQFFYATIEANSIVPVWENRVLLYKNHLPIRGHLRVIGEVHPV